MNWLDFLSSIIASLAWPIVILITVFMLKKPLIERLAVLKSLKMKGIELDFSESLEELEEKYVEKYNDKDDVIEAWDLAIDKKIEELTKIDPGTGIIYAWTELETTLRNKTSLGSVNHNRPTSAINLMKEAINNRMIDEKNYNLFMELRVLRNQITHDKNSTVSLSYEDAIRYVEFIKQIIHELNTSVPKIN